MQAQDVVHSNDVQGASLPIVKLYTKSYLILVFLTTLFLTGSVDGVPYKYLLTAIIGVAFLGQKMARGAPLRVQGLLESLIVLTSITFAALVGSWNGYSSHYVIAESANMLSPLVVVMLYDSDVVEPTSVLRVALAGSTIYSIAKIFLVGSIFLHPSLYSHVYSDVYGIFHYNIMSQPIWTSLVRFYSANDLFVAGPALSCGDG